MYYIDAYSNHIIEHSRVLLILFGHADSYNSGGIVHVQNELLNRSDIQLLTSVLLLAFFRRTTEKNLQYRIRTFLHTCCPILGFNARVIR